eukprot:CAMPEP_0196584422 /NCGR_PEP_ID=MMETSP1081-20130531/47014_1 /TAXON_ID=36882 /ORGANISM="Pyramimonas amylifera, Strain CCMP720" /LENGTH=64 /DNA_ID=CAMNT_0041905621 /DNA_START=832 /DNA_END=1026 /DNA_ORIENTATION=-
MSNDEVDGLVVGESVVPAIVPHYKQAPPQEAHQVPPEQAQGRPPSVAEVRPGKVQGGEESGILH